MAKKPPLSRTHVLSEVDRQLFAQAMKHVTPLHTEQSTPKKKQIDAKVEKKQEVRTNTKLTQGKIKPELTKKDKTNLTLDATSIDVFSDIDDNDLFLQAMQDVTPLHCDKTAPQSKKPLPVLQQNNPNVQKTYAEMLSDFYDPTEMETGEELLFARNGVQRRVIQNLRRGHYSINGELDLHGMTVPIAREALIKFLHRYRRSEQQCVRIVHGKGNGSWQKQPILKIKINQWLQQRDEVLAFCSAPSKDGGTGAVYVLLKRIQWVK